MQGAAANAYRGHNEDHSGDTRNAENDAMFICAGSAYVCSVAHQRSMCLSRCSRKRASSPIVAHPRALVTPHAAFYSVEGERELRTKAAQNLIDWTRTGRPKYVVVEGRAIP